MTPTLPIFGSLRRLARLGGAMYLVTIVAGLFRELYVKGQLVVPGDLASTATRLHQFESLWRAGIAAELVMVACGVVLMWVLYALLRPTDPGLALLMTFFGLVALAIEGAAAVLLIQAVLPINAASLQTLSPEVKQGLMGLALRSHEYGFGMALLMFGPFFLIAGRLIWKSGLFPKTVGALYQVAGIGYVVHSVAMLLAPAAAGLVFMVVALPIFVGESMFCLWLLFKTFDEGGQL